MPRQPYGPDPGGASGTGCGGHRELPSSRAGFSAVLPSPSGERACQVRQLHAGRSADGRRHGTCGRRTHAVHRRGGPRSGTGQREPVDNPRSGYRHVFHFLPGAAVRPSTGGGLAGPARQGPHARRAGDVLAARSGALEDVEKILIQQLARRADRAGPGRPTRSAISAETPTLNSIGRDLGAAEISTLGLGPCSGGHCLM